MRFEPRKRTRIKGYDYSQPGAYFFTICTHQQRRLFGSIKDGALRPNAYGNAVRQAWLSLPASFPHVELDAFVIMPNHVHGILILKPPNSRGAKRADLSSIFATLKSFSTRAINRLRGRNTPPIWQRGFYEHVLRPEEDINEYRRYIIDNPLKWHLDELNADVT